MSPAPTLTNLDLETADRLRAVIGKLSRRLRPAPAAVAAGLTPTRISVLLTVVREGTVRLSDLADSEGINPTQLSRAVAHLVDSGLVERSADEGDRRAAWLKPTAAGRRLTERIRRERTDALNGALESLSPDERERILTALPALEDLAEHLKAERP
ncbi:MAG: MarR family transcriptional regulator [Solirubrobacterales bacterium]|nr:MarR family transcriptional regulator [Solirubrobacterales bacterium]MBV9681774.1 MarR family transcriptional regulator [Solirubrobacterales bacterium]MBV9809217.1 MarR family transcriptional regulator [Solirubrobacterales bacterium]